MNTVVRTRPAVIRALGILATAMVAVAGCSSNAKDAPGTPSATQSTSTQSTSTQGSGGDLIAQSKQIVTASVSGLVTGPSNGFVDPKQIKPVTSFPSPEPANPGGKTHRVAIIACEEQGLCGRLAQVEKAVFQKLGWQVSVSTAVFSAGVSADQAFQQAWNSGVATKPEVIIGLAVSGIFVQQQLQQARAAGIKTIDVFQGPESGQGYDVYVPASFNLQRELQAAYSVSSSNGKSNNLVIDLQGFANLATPDEMSYLKSCTGCHTDEKSVQINDNIDPVKVQALVSSLARTKKYDYISLSTGGGANAGYDQGLRVSGSAAKILSVDAIPQNADLIHEGTFAAITWVPADWIAFLGVDAAIRAVTGATQPAITDWSVGVGLWDSTNAPAKGSSWLGLTESGLARFDFLAPYAKAWGLSENDLKIAG
jgi:ABC-type sugar transport system substrate-binding protein